ncbi:MAG: class A beta-lactamase [Sphingomonas sp.]|nr:class A beta-lactamase [Sphingomonas sp.]
MGRGGQGAGIDRRSVLLGGAVFPIAAVSHAQDVDPLEIEEALARQRARLGSGGRLGVAAWDGGNRRVGLDAHSRYAMCSTFKLPLAAAILAGAELERWSLADEIQFDEYDLLDYAPTVRAGLERGRMSIEALCAAAMLVSDNSAANLLLARLGGPRELTAFLRRCGDRVTRLDRIEPDLNTNLPGDVRDTTTPGAMVALMWTLLFGEVLGRSSRLKLVSWMARATTGRDRLRAGIPGDWRVGDKTGTGANGAYNDIAFALTPRRVPVLIACYASGGDASADERADIHAEVGRIVASAFS